MAEFRIIVFDVEQGLCVFARTPNGYGVMIDCGRSTSCSPTSYIAEREAPTLTLWNGHALARLIITHPHDDHVEDIQSVIGKLKPAILTRHKDYDWEQVMAPPDNDPSRNTKAYYAWQQTYSHPALELPDLGLKLQTFALTPSEASGIDSNMQHSLNNSSYVTVFTWDLGQGGYWKVVVAGDNETAGWEALVRKRGFAEAVRGADFYITAHHGHDSGFSGDLFAAMGSPMANISSVRSGNESMKDYGPYARGADFYGASRTHLTTRADGHIVLTMTERGYEFRASKRER